MKIIKEFRDFAMRGSVVDLAVGVIIGAAFSSVVKSLVDDLISPLIGLVGNKDFTNYYLPLSPSVSGGLALADARKLGPVLAYGSFFTAVLHFLIVAVCIFALIKVMNQLWTKPPPAPAAPPPPSAEEKLLAEIRDLLRTSTRV